MDYIKYKKINNYENYIIFTTGKIYSIKSKKFLKPQNNGSGYLIVGFYKNNKEKKYTIHRLVALAFIPNINNYKEIDHINRNKCDNNVINLRWSTRREQNINRTIKSNIAAGVSYSKKDNSYVGTWCKKRKSFSLKKYGKEKALELAIQFRHNLEKLYYNNIV